MRMTLDGETRARIVGQLGEASRPRDRIRVRLCSIAFGNFERVIAERRVASHDIAAHARELAMEEEAGMIDRFFAEGQDGLRALASTAESAPTSFLHEDPAGRDCVSELLR